MQAYEKVNVAEDGVEIAVPDELDTSASEAAAPPAAPPAARPWASTTISGDAIEPGNVSLEFFRKEVLRASLVILAISIPALFLTPIVGILMSVSAVLVSFWLRDAARFQHGGDPHQWMSRNCSLMFFSVACGVCLVITLIDVITLGVKLSANGSDRSANASVHRNAESNHRPWRIAALVVNSALFPLLLYATYCTKRLRGIIGSSP